jgi:hypothetical protein
LSTDGDTAYFREINALRNRRGILSFASDAPDLKPFDRPAVNPLFIGAKNILA